jgi:hypothetical protein
VRANGFLIDDKTRTEEKRKSFTITEAMWEKILSEAFRTPPGLLPALRILVGTHRLRVVREQDFLYLESRANSDD